MHGISSDVAQIQEVMGEKVEHLLFFLFLLLFILGSSYNIISYEAFRFKPGLSFFIGRQSWIVYYEDEPH